MTHIFQLVDEALIAGASNAIDARKWNATGSRKDFLKAMTIQKDYYEGLVVWEFNQKRHSENFSALVNSGDAEKAAQYAEKHGIRLQDDQVFKFEAMVMMQCLENYETAQKLADDFFYGCLKKDFYAEHGELLRLLINSESNKTIAKMPRNKHYKKAMSILSATWKSYPGAPQESLCESVRNYFSGGVSVDSLKKWIKKAGIRPEKPKKHTSFSLVIPDDA